MSKESPQNEDSLVSLLIDRESLLIDRDLSWLQFNERVLAQGEDSSIPLLERLKFLGITSSNFDEFFMVRFASLRKKVRALKKSKTRKDEYRRQLQIQDEMIRAVPRFIGKQRRLFDSLIKELSEHKIQIVKKCDKDNELEALARELFYQEVLPVLPGFTEQQSARLQHIGNIQKAIVFPDRGLLIVPRETPGFFLKQHKKQTWVFGFEDLVQTFLAEALGKENKSLIFRLTRDADVFMDLQNEDTELIPDIVRKKIGSREHRKVLRIQYIESTTNTVDLERIADFFKVKKEYCFGHKYSLSLRNLISLPDKLKEVAVSGKLFYPPLKQCVPYPFDKKEKILSELGKRDYFFHHPYDSFASYTNFLEAAVADKNVESIQQTVYRADALSDVTDLLCQAAKKGKKVRVFIEPRARFDEINNISLAEQLRSAGVEVIFASGKLKMHAKLANITRRRGKELESFTHLSTGNYNSKTARIYTDMAIITSDEVIGKDARKFFDSIAGEELPEDLEALLIAPTGLHRKLLKLIHGEIANAMKGEPSFIYAKMNALIDPKIIASLYKASQAGVKIHLNVRGACALLPGLKGVSDNITVTSIVDRFLEHSRVYYFQHEGEIYLSSADWMPRNFFSRLEIAFPIKDERIYDFISERVIPSYLQDNVKARKLSRQGVWRKASVRDGKSFQAQKEFTLLAERQYCDTPLDR